MRVLLIAVVMLSLSLVPVFAQPTAATAVTLTVTNQLGDMQAPHQVNADGVTPNSDQALVLFDPAGNQTVFHTASSSAGHAAWSLAAPGGGWQLGLYRIVLALPESQSVSATFAAGDGQPHLFAGPNLPSPTSAFNFSGIGLKPNTTVPLNVLLTGGQGERTIDVGVDAAGTFSIFIWPQEMGVPFFAAGNYLVQIPTLALRTAFQVREHPVSATLAVRSPFARGAPASLSLRHYPASRWVWTVYSDASGRQAGELLLGPVNLQGSVDATVQLSLPTGGHYYMASPYDWGETAFDVLEPTPTATLLVSTLTPTPTDVATMTPIPTVQPSHASTTKTRRCSRPTHGKKRKRSCKRRDVARATVTPVKTPTAR
ncbi:MAG: hypothetical protein NVSMB22_24030 [Chloroflexota bacterium]